MDRNRFLALASRYACGEKVTVRCDGIEYYPINYTIEPKPGGVWQHTVKLKDTKAHESYRYEKLEKIEEETT